MSLSRLHFGLLPHTFDGKRPVGHLSSELYIESLSLMGRRYRFDAGDMTQQELADKVGVTRQTILSIEKGKFKPSVELALRLARVLGTSVEQLFELEDEKENHT